MLLNNESADIETGGIERPAHIDSDGNLIPPGVDANIQSLDCSSEPSSEVLKPNWRPTPRRTRDDDQASWISESCTLSKALDRHFEGALKEDLLELVTFRGCEALLRGIHLSQALAQYGAIFSKRSSPENTYRESRCVRHLDYFLSHTWRTPRAQKYTALASYFHLRFALFATFSFGLCLMAFAVWGPNYTVYNYLEDHEGSILCRSLLLPFFVVMLLCAEQLKRRIRLRGPVIFLDKACIEQQDLELQQQGIRKLAAFLCKSKRMLMLHTGCYFRRLWTVYEVASFLTFHSISDIDVVRVDQCWAILKVAVLYWGVNLALILMRALTNRLDAMYVMLFFISCVIFKELRAGARARLAVSAELQSFEVRDTECEVETDRQLVYRNIHALMKACGVVRREATVDEALDAFSCRVRMEMPRAFASSLAPLTLSFNGYILLGWCGGGSHLLDMISDYFAATAEDAPFEALDEVARSLLWAFGGWPLLTVMGEVTAGSCLHLTGMKDKVWCMVMVLFFDTLMFTIHYPRAILLDLVLDKSCLWLANVCLTIGLSLLTYWLAAVCHSGDAAIKASQPQERRSSHGEGHFCSDPGSCPCQCSLGEPQTQAQAQTPSISVTETAEFLSRGSSLVVHVRSLRSQEPDGTREIEVAGMDSIQEEDGRPESPAKGGGAVADAAAIIVGGLDVKEGEDVPPDGEARAKSEGEKQQEESWEAMDGAKAEGAAEAEASKAEGEDQSNGLTKGQLKQSL